MTQEEQQLLLKDLCARLPYGVKLDTPDGVDTLGNVDTNEGWINASYDVDEVKPYLRPMSSMTEEEEKELAEVMVRSQDCSYQNNELATTMVNDWYLSKGFDVRGLIPKGLAFETPEGMYK